MAFAQIAVIDGLCRMAAEVDSFKYSLLGVALLEEEVRPNIETVSNNLAKCYFSQQRVIDQGIETGLPRWHSG